MLYKQIWLDFILLSMIGNDSLKVTARIILLELSGGTISKAANVILKWQKSKTPQKGLLEFKFIFSSFIVWFIKLNLHELYAQTNIHLEPSFFLSMAFPWKTLIEPRNGAKSTRLLATLR